MRFSWKIKKKTWFSLHKHGNFLPIKINCCHAKFWQISKKKGRKLEKNRAIAWLLTSFDNIFLTWQRCPVFLRLARQSKIFLWQPCKQRRFPRYGRLLLGNKAYRKKKMILLLPHFICSHFRWNKYMERYF